MTTVVENKGRKRCDGGCGCVDATVEGHLEGRGVAAKDIASLFYMAGDSSSAAVWSLAIDGQRLLNCVGLALLAAHDVARPDEVGVDAAKLADELECWTERYARIWYEVSRQSELGRIQHVV